MDKLKIIKTMVFILTFCMIFALCLLVGKVFEKSTSKPIEVKISGIKDAKIDNFKISENFIYIQTSNKIHIIDVKKGNYKGMIFVTEDK